MKRKYFLSILLLLQVIIAAAQDLPAFKSLRYDENYGFLKNDTAHNWYKHIKYKPLDAAATSYLGFGGEIRFQYLWFHNENWGDAPADKDGYILTRYLAHADLHAGKTFRAFVQLQSSLVNGRINTSPVEENPLEVHQAFADILVAQKKHSSLLFRVGRQEFSYGSQRLVSVRELPNNRQSFDAVKSVWKIKDYQLDLFYSHYVAAKKGIFDDGFNESTKFWGAYLVKNNLPLHANIDLYYLGLWKKQAVFDDGKARELRHSIGTRLWNRLHDFTYDYEAVYQWGNFGDRSISAWTISFNSLYRFSHAALKPELGLKAEQISGDAHYNDNHLQSFNPLFPRGAYFGLAAIIGPSNLTDFHPSVSLELQKEVKLNFDADFFWRYSSNDGIYAPNVALIYSGKNIQGKFIGSQYAADLVYTPNNFLYFRTEFTWFAAGSFLKAAGTGKDILFSSFTAQLKF